MYKRIMMMVAAGWVGIAGLGAAPLDTRQVAADAQWVVHVDADRLWTADIGKLLKNEIAVGELKAKVEALQLILGLNVVTDIKGLTVYGDKTGSQRAALLVQGNFDPERMTTLLRAASEYAGKEYQGHTLHHWVDANAKNDASQGNRWGAFYNKNLIVMGGDEALTTAALDVLDGRKPALKADAKIGGYSLNAAGLILLLAADLKSVATDAMQNPNPNAALVQNADGLLLTLKEQEKNVLLALVLRAKSPDVAASLEQALRGIQALGVLTANRNPELAQLAQAMQVSSGGSDVKATIAFGSQALFNMLKAKAMAGAPVQAAPAPAPAPAPPAPQP